MAQYLPYIPETIPEPALYKPDFNFFDRMLQRKQSMFEQGLSRVRSAYTSVLNAPLSNKHNIPLRDQYIKNAQEQLTKLSSSDLSLMENVNAAESIYAPFWQDKFIVQDAAMTKGYQAEMQKLMSWRDSPKLEEREKYNAISMMDLQNGLSVLQNADRTPEAFGAVEMRKAEPFTNIEAYLQKMATAEKLEVKYDDPNGPYLIETKNGQRSQQKYATWAASRIGNNFQGQFDVTGRVENEERIKILKRNNPNLTDQEIKGIIAKDVVSELNQGYTKRTQEVDVEIARIDSLLGSIGQTGGPQHEQMFNKLVQERAELVAKKSAINEEYKYFDQGKDKVLDYVTNAPKQYFSVLAKQRLINNWATGTASIDQKLVKENTGFTAAQNIELRKAEHNLAVNNAAFDQWYKQWSKQLDINNPNKGTGTIKDANGNDIPAPTVPGVDESASLVYSGKSGIDITKTAATAYDFFDQNQKKEFNDSFNLIFDQRGILGFATKLGLDQKEISLVATAFKKEVAGLGTGVDYKFNAEEAKASEKLRKALLNSSAIKDAGIKDITGPGTMRNALIAYSGQYLSERSKVAADGSDIPLNNDEFEALMRYSTAISKLQSYNANEQNREKLFQEKIASNPDYKSIVTKGADGKSKLLTISDMAADMPTLQLRNKDGSGLLNLTKEEVAKLYMQGKLGPTSQTELNIKDLGNYYIESVNNKKSDSSLFGLIGGDGTSLWNTIYKDKIQPKYGEPGAISKKIQEANEKIVPDLLMYKNLMGRQGSLFALIPKGNKTMANGDNAVLAIYQASQTGNSEDVYDKDGKKIENVEKINAIRTLLSSEKNIEEYVSGQYIPQGINGKRTVRVILNKVLSSETKGSIAGQNIAEIGDVFNFVLKDDTAATYLDQLPNNSGYQIYQALTRGQEVKSDPILDAAGFSYTVTPNTMGVDAEPEYVTVDLKYKVRTNKKDPQTGQLVTGVEEKSYLHRINLKGSDAKSPDEIIGKLQSLYYENMMKNRSVQQEYQNYINTNRGNGTSMWDPKAALEAAGLSRLLK